MTALTFAALQEGNLARQDSVYFNSKDWSPTDWACAMAGECGEACNLIKKLRRGEDVPMEDIAFELADMVIYADLLSTRLGIDLGTAVRAKFNFVSEHRVGTETRI